MMEKDRLKELVIEKTLDCSDTLYVPSLDEHYHSTNGAVQEAKHVFIEAGLLQCLEKKELNILEIGFGTGLNAYLTLKEILKTDITLNYTTLELYPLPIDLIKKLNYALNLSYEDKELFLSIHNANWDIKTTFKDKITFLKLKADINQVIFTLDTKVDLIYFDAFAPNKQPELWTQPIFDKLFSLLNNKGILTTYCAKGAVRRMLLHSGFIVDRLPGPLGKREMLRASKG